jgi:hypothetical protein
MPADFSWLIGKRLVEGFKKDFTWFFGFTGSGRIWTESSWRFVRSEHIYVTSEDDGQLFGLKEPINAALRVLDATRDAKILECRVALRTSDLQLDFEGNCRLEFLTMSSGYESWRTENASQSVYCTGGGNLATFPRDRDV